MSRKLRAILLICAAVNLAVVVWDLATGGIYVRVFGTVMSSWQIVKPIRYATVCVAVAMWLGERGAAATSWAALPRYAAPAAQALAITSIVIAGMFGIRAAGGADAFGYVSQAEQWVDGRLIAPDALAPLSRAIGAAVAPLGYTLAPTPDGIVPIYPPGLPLLMAFAQHLAGRNAVYTVVPLLGGLTVWMTYVIGARAADERTGFVAALLVAFSPLFVFHTFEPMSDVPATAWWTSAWAMALGPGASSAFGAGVAVAAAILTRPNLAPLAVLLLPVVALQSPQWRRTLFFAAAAASGCALVAAFNAALYGSSLASGYGPLGAMFAPDHAAPNLARYTRWMIELHTPVLLIAFAAPMVRPTRAVAWMAVFCVAVVASYLFYLVFDDWPFARFLLPALPLLFVLVSITIVRVLAAVPAGARGALLLVVCVLLVSSYLATAHRHGMFLIQGAEQRYVVIGRRLAVALPARAIVLSVIHSGSLRLYARRPTIRWDFLAPDRLDATIALLQHEGYEPYLLLEQWEEPLFRTRFAAANVHGRLDWPASMEYRGAEQVRLYCIEERGRHRAGDRIITSTIAVR